jgi:hypothetical protein
VRPRGSVPVALIPVPCHRIEGPDCSPHRHREKALLEPASVEHGQARRRASGSTGRSPRGWLDRTLCWLVRPVFGRERPPRRHNDTSASRDNYGHHGRDLTFARSLCPAPAGSPAFPHPRRHMRPRSGMQARREGPHTTVGPEARRRCRAGSAHCSSMKERSTGLCDLQPRESASRGGVLVIAVTGFRELGRAGVWGSSPWKTGALARRPLLAPREMTLMTTANLPVRYPRFWRAVQGSAARPATDALGGPRLHHLCLAKARPLSFRRAGTPACGGSTLRSRPRGVSA